MVKKEKKDDKELSSSGGLATTWPCSMWHCSFILHRGTSNTKTPTTFNQLIQSHRFLRAGFRLLIIHLKCRTTNVPRQADDVSPPFWANSPAESGRVGSIVCSSRICGSSRPHCVRLIANYPMTDEPYPRCGRRIEVCKWVGPIHREGFDRSTHAVVSSPSFNRLSSRRDFFKSEREQSSFCATIFGPCEGGYSSDLRACGPPRR